MAHNDRNTPDPSLRNQAARQTEDESADTASFQRFVEEQESARTTGDGRSFRLLALGVGAIVLVVLVLLLLQ